MGSRTLRTGCGIAITIIPPLRSRHHSKTEEFTVDRIETLGVADIVARSNDGILPSLPIRHNLQILPTRLSKICLSFGGFRQALSHG